MVYWRGKSESGDLNVFKRAYVGGTSFVSSVKVDPSKQKIKKGTSFTFTADVIGTVTTVKWSVSGNYSSGTYIDQYTGKLTVGSDESAYSLNVRASSTLDPGVYGDATAYVVDEDVYISSVTLSPATATVPRGGSQYFQVTVEGTDFSDVTWSITEHTSSGTRISSGDLYIGSDESVSVIKVRATSVRNTDIYGEATVTVADQKTITNAKVVYNENTVGLTTSLTGRQVSEALNNAIDFGEKIEGTYVYSGGRYTCLCKDIVIDSENRATFTALDESDEYINTSDEYYYVFNIENDAGYIFDTDNIPSVTINGVSADMVYWRNKSESGDLNVFKRAYVDGTNPYKAEFETIDVPLLYEGYSDSENRIVINVKNTGSERLNLNTNCISLSNTTDFQIVWNYGPTYIDPGQTATCVLRLKNGDSFTGKPAGEYTTTLTFRDTEGRADAISKKVTVYVYREVDEVYFTIPTPYAGAYAENNRDLFGSGEPSKYFLSAGEWCTKGADGRFYDFDGGQFQMGHVYYVWIELEAEDPYLFATNHSSGSNAVEHFYANNKEVSLVGELNNNAYTIDFMFAVQVTKELGADVEVTPCPSSAFTEGVDYTVDGQYVTVYGDTPCKVGYLSGGKYEACSIYSYSGNRHTFVVPDSVDEVILVIKGDVDLSGEFDFFDVVVSKAMDLHPEDGYSIEELFAADVDDDGEFSFFDVILTKAADLGKTPFSW